MIINTKPPTLSTEGYHVARCFSMVQIGTIFIVTKWQAQIRLGWEMPYDQREFKPMVFSPKQIEQDFASNLYGKSHLKRHLVSWLGADVVEEIDRTQKLDPATILGRPCYIKIEHKRNPNSGSWYEEITDIKPCLEAECPEQYNPNKLLDFSKFDVEVFNSLPFFVADKIMRSREFPGLGVTYTPKKKQQEQPPVDDPF